MNNDDPHNGDRNLWEETHLNLIRTQDFLEHEFAAYFSGFGITGPQYNVLRVLSQSPDKKLPIKKISPELVRREPDISRLVDRLEKSGLVERRRCSKDRRVVWVKLTPLGEDTLELARPGLQELRQRIFTCLGRENLAKLNELLIMAREGNYKD